MIVDYEEYIEELRRLLLKISTYGETLSMFIGRNVISIGSVVSVLLLDFSVIIVIQGINPDVGGVINCSMFILEVVIITQINERNLFLIIVIIRTFMRGVRGRHGGIVRGHSHMVTNPVGIAVDKSVAMG